MKKLKLKKKVKVFFITFLIIIVLIVLLITKFISLNNYNDAYSYIKMINKNGDVLEKIDLDYYKTSQFLFLDKELKIGLEYNSIEKKGDDGYKIINLDNVSYTFRYKVSKSKEDYKEYFTMINNIERLYDNKRNIITPIYKLISDTNSINKIKKNIPGYKEIAILDGNSFNGYIYKVDDIYNAILYGNNLKVEMTFIGDKLDYSYLKTLISTVSID